MKRMLKDIITNNRKINSIFIFIFSISIIFALIIHFYSKFDSKKYESKFEAYNTSIDSVNVIIQKILKYDRDNNIDSIKNIFDFEKYDALSNTANFKDKNDFKIKKYEAFWDSISPEFSLKYRECVFNNYDSLKINIKKELLNHGEGLSKRLSFINLTEYFLIVLFLLLYPIRIIILYIINNIDF